MTDQPTFASPLTANHFQKPKKKKAQNHDSEAKRMKLLQEEEEEERLTNLLFGGGIGVDDTEAAWHDDDDDDDEEESVQSEESDNQDLFQIDRTGVVHSESEEEEEQDDEESEEEEEQEKVNTASAWHDDDDEELQVSLQASDRTKKLRSNLVEDTVSGSTYEQKLRERYEATTGATSRTDWAALPESDDDKSDLDSDQEFESNFLSSTAPLLSNNRLQPNILNVVRCPDANLGHYNQSTVNAVQFHPGSDEDEPLMLTAGLDKTLRFFKINGTEGSEKVHGIHFPNLPIYSAAFLGDTGSVVVSGRRKFFYIYDAVAGKVSASERSDDCDERSEESEERSDDCDEQGEEMRALASPTSISEETRASVAE